MAHEDTFDYVVIGAGSAGCVLARRLTEDPAVRVLVLEAGGLDRAREIHVPAAFPRLLKTEYDWSYYTEPEPRLDDRPRFWPRGKVLGGSSSINAMVYVRGNPLDYDRWEAIGNPGWGWADVLPYFLKSEDQERGASAHHGVGGPLRVSDPRSVNPLSRAFVDACLQVGIRRNRDFNGPTQEGAGFYQLTQQRGERASAATAFLEPVLERRNLEIRSGVLATRLRLEGDRVVGVEYARGRTLCRVRAARETLLSAGAINSPQLLLLSGFGPADELRALGIPVVMDLPGVGRNLQDHGGSMLAHRSRVPNTLERADRWYNRLEYALLRRGPLTSNVDEAGGFVAIRRGRAVPDMQLHFAPTFYLSESLPAPSGPGFTLAATHLHLHARGSVTLRSRDPRDPPVIRYDYLADPGDEEDLVEALRLLREIALAPALARFRGPEVYPGAAVRGRDQLRAYLRATIETIYHPVGTCKMGSDPMAVVSTRLDVYGVRGLRVIDASVIPKSTSGNTNAPTLMIAEKAADLLRGESCVRPRAGHEECHREQDQREA